jgi:hypothetical protein
VAGAANGWYAAYDAWYEATKEGPNPDAEEEEDDAAADPDGEEAIHDREIAKLNIAIEERLAELTHETRENEASVWAGRRRLGDLIDRTNELIAQQAARCPRPTGAPTRRLQRRSSAAKSAGIAIRRTTRPRTLAASASRHETWWNVLSVLCGTSDRGGSRQ